MVSVILPSYNSERTIVAVLNALKNQTFSEPYEIILVDSSSDSTPDLVRTNFPDIQFIHLEKKTDPGTARNLGISNSTGSIILFIDSDCIAESNWIERMVNIHRKNPDFLAVGGSVKNGNRSNSAVAWAGYMAEFREFIPEQQSREVKHIPTCNISYKREILINLKGFNPDYYPQEDLDFNYRLIQSGGKILFNPEIQVKHTHRTELSSFFKHQLRIGNITSKMLKILDLEGYTIVRSKLKLILAILFIPLVKWVRTFQVFWKLNRQIITTHPVSVFIFGIGLIPWTIGFIKGAFEENGTAGNNSYA